MKKRWICSALTLTLAAGLLTGCGSSSGSAAGTAGELNIFVWTEYVPDSVIEKFEEETGSQSMCPPIPPMKICWPR